MGLSRNKVAVSEGAAGSPPFYGESEHNQPRVEDVFIFGNSTDRKSQTSGLRPMEELREAAQKQASAQISCCSIVSDLRQKSQGSLKQRN